MGTPGVDEIDQLRIRLDQLEKEKVLLQAVIAQLRGMLARLEWTGGGEGSRQCPVCGAYKTDGQHRGVILDHGNPPDCWLAVELHR